MRINIRRVDWAKVVGDLTASGLTYRTIGLIVGCDHATIINGLARQSDFGHNLGERLLELWRRVGDKSNRPGQYSARHPMSSGERDGEADSTDEGPGR